MSKYLIFFSEILQALNNIYLINNYALNPPVNFILFISDRLLLKQRSGSHYSL